MFPQEKKKIRRRRKEGKEEDKHPQGRCEAILVRYWLDATHPQRRWRWFFSSYVFGEAITWIRSLLPKQHVTKNQTLFLNHSFFAIEHFHGPQEFDVLTKCRNKTITKNNSKVIKSEGVMMFVEKVDSDTLERETVNHTFLDITALVPSRDHQQPRPHPNGHHEHEDSLQFNNYVAQKKCLSINYSYWVTR